MLELPNGIPRKDVFRRVLMTLRPGGFQACFANWLNSLRAIAATTTGVGRPVLAVDGKTGRRSHDRKRPGHFAFGPHLGRRVWSVARASGLHENSNEITAIPELLRLVDFKGRSSPSTRW